MATQKTDGVPQLNHSTVEIIRVDAEKIIVSLDKTLVGVPDPGAYDFRIHWIPEPNPNHESGVDAFRALLTRSTLEGLRPSTKYCITVSCYRGNEWLSETKINVTTADSPTAPPLQIPKLDDSTVEYVRISDEAVKVSWKKALEGISNPDDYLFELAWYATIDNPKNQLFFNRLKNETEFTITGLNPSEIYNVNVNCYTVEGEERLSRTVIKGISTKAPVPKLDNSTVEIIRVDAEKIIVSLEKAAAGVPMPRNYDYRIHWVPQPNPNHEDGTFAFRGGYQMKCTLTGLKPSTKYSICFQCFRGEEQISELTKIITTTETPTAPPLQIPKLDDFTVKYTRIDNQTVKVNWEKALEGISNPEDYVFELSWHATDTNVDRLVYFDRIYHDAVHTITGLNPATTYSVYLTCYSAEGEERLNRTAGKVV